MAKTSPIFAITNFNIDSCWQNHRVLYCVAGGVAFGAAAALTIAHFFKPSVCEAENSSPQSSSTGTNKKLTLHVYDHCPYCVRVELSLGWKGISFERKVYGYGDSASNKPNTMRRTVIFVVACFKAFARHCIPISFISIFEIAVSQQNCRRYAWLEQGKVLRWPHLDRP